jgi:hypothetical protein
MIVQRCIFFILVAVIVMGIPFTVFSYWADADKIVQSQENIESGLNQAGELFAGMRRVLNTAAPVKNNSSRFSRINCRQKNVPNIFLDNNSICRAVKFIAEAFVRSDIGGNFKKIIREINFAKSKIYQSYLWAGKRN